MDKVQVLARSRSDFAGGVDELTFRGTGTLDKTEYGYQLRYTAQNETDGSGVASEIRLETAQRRAVVISESKDGGYGLLLDPRRTTVTQIAGGDGGALTLHVETKEVSWHLPRRGEGHITLAYTLLLGTQALSALRLELTLTKEERRMNMIDSAKAQVRQLTAAAYDKAAAAGLLPAGIAVEPAVEIPKDTANGDYTTTFCLAAAKAMKMNPRQVAQTLIDNMTLEGSYFTSVEIAGPGFMNFRLGEKWFSDTVAVIESEGERYGENDSLSGKKYMVEFVSANPTGPMHMGNARGGVLGDTLASVLQKSGADVWREFYVNDAGNQIEKFAKSLEARYFQIIRGEDAVEFPEDGYHGDDIRELAQAFYEKEGEKYLDCDEKTRHDALAQFGLSVNIPKMKSDLARYGIQYDQWFFESSLHESGYVADTVAALTDKGYTYEKDGALWLKTSQILAENLRRAGKSDEAIEKLGLKDDVLRRANGFYTYFAADIAYHRNKFAVRGFDKVINIWGADHHGHVARLKGAMDALGLDGEHRLDIVLMQLVKLVRDGEIVRMSKRTGKAISLTDLLDEIPVDACRWFFNAKPETQMEFDLGLAVREDSENPVYYVQYAYARICTLLKALAAEGHTVPAAADADLSVLTADEERALIKQLAQYPAVVYLAARDYDPSFINRYLGELAAAFHKFYNACRIKGEAENVLLARLKLADTARAVLKNGMTLIGCSAPEKM